ncbi:hypothetical protein D3C72_2472220 [compost metagenome]
MAAHECRIDSVTVIGLPQPGPIGLDHQRAETLATVLKLYGLPEATFEVGDEADRRRPQVALDAAPRR